MVFLLIGMIAQERMGGKAEAAIGGET